MAKEIILEPEIRILEVNQTSVTIQVEDEDGNTFEEIKDTTSTTTCQANKVQEDEHPQHHQDVNCAMDSIGEE